IFPSRKAASWSRLGCVACKPFIRQIPKRPLGRGAKKQNRRGGFRDGDPCRLGLLRRAFREEGASQGIFLMDGEIFPYVTKTLHFLPEAIQDPGFGDEHRIHGDSEFLSHRVLFSALKQDRTESSPRRWRKIRLDHFQQTMHYVAVVLLVPQPT